MAHLELGKVPLVSLSLLKLRGDWAGWLLALLDRFLVGHGSAIDLVLSLFGSLSHFVLVFVFDLV